MSKDCRKEAEEGAQPVESGKWLVGHSFFVRYDSLKGEKVLIYKKW